jgi:hypothetical protein
MDGFGWVIDFFPGESKIFQGGKKLLFALKNFKKVLFSSKKPKTYYSNKDGQGGSKSPLAPPPDAFGQGTFSKQV